MIEQDRELLAMSQTFEALKSLNKPQVSRILNWVKDRFAITHGKTTIDAASIITAEPIIKEEDIQNETREPEIKPRQKKEPIVPKTPNNKSLADYDTVADLFKDADTKKVSLKILLMAAYLQERLDYKEISSYDINLRLKKMGHGVQNIASSINGILSRNPQIITEIVKEGQTKNARRAFRVTEEGLKVVENLLRGAEK